jgi:UDP-N-acetylmuramoyl-L-alanyl-D-glutamate--2,6-diaminopimelate ligase
MIDIVKDIKGLSADSREIKDGYLFAALSGTHHDGRDYIDQAIKNGATHILAATGTKIPDGIKAIESDNPRRDFAYMAAAFYGEQPNHIVAITGTNGKTSCVDFVRQIFEHLSLKSASLGTLGLISNHMDGDNVMTTPDPVTLHKLLSCLKSKDIDYLAMEASSHGLDQHRMDGVQPKVAAFTNLTQDHLDYHGDMETYFKAKERLFTDILDDDSIAVLNADDEWVQRITHNNIIRFGRNNNADLKLLSQTPLSNGQDIEISYKGEPHKIHLGLIGEFQSHNVLCAAACCISLGLELSGIFGALPTLKNVPGRVELAMAHDNMAAYIDYAHTPDALEQVLKSLRPHVQNRLICIFGAGGDRDRGKRPLMGKIVSNHADIAIITDDNPRSEDPDTIRSEIQSACPNSENIGDRAKAIARGVALLQKGDILLIAGKGHETGQTIGSQTFPFDDKVITQKLMKDRFEA